MIVNLFPHFSVVREAKPEWLKPQRLDVFITDLNLACEYQGEQHYKSIEYFGGEEALQKNHERDEIKKKKCKENGVKLIYFYHWEELNESLVRSKLSEYIKKS